MNTGKRLFDKDAMEEFVIHTSDSDLDFDVDDGTDGNFDDFPSDDEHDKALQIEELTDTLAQEEQNI